MADPYGLDFETFSSVNLPKAGLDNYLASPDFQVLLASVAYPDRPTERFDFMLDRGARKRFKQRMSTLPIGTKIVAQNARFERRVLRKMGLTMDARVIDSAVMARLLGAGSSLAVASRQLTNIPKLEEGYDLMRKFSIPHEGMRQPSIEYCQEHAEDWDRYGYYCDVDAEGSLAILLNGLEILKELRSSELWDREVEFELLTWQQNLAGWPVDLEAVSWMNNRAWANSQIAKAVFIQNSGKELNFNSPKQLKDFCAERGVKVTSMDKYHAPALLQSVVDRLAAATDETIRQQLAEVVTMLETKFEIGGSTLSKLPVIQSVVAADGRVRDQYVHVGAGQTFRTSGRAVQMQNLARLDGNIRELETLQDLSIEWTNTDMAGQMRQVFTASHPDGKLIVGDFSAVESRALAYLAGEEWKLEAYREEKDLYKVLVTKYNGISYEEVTSEMRPKGKYTELSCGYQASGAAVKNTMLRYGFTISLEEASTWVSDWRTACPEIVKFWAQLDACLKAVVASNIAQEFFTGYGQKVRMTPFILPSVYEVAPQSVSLCIQIFHAAPRQKDAYVTRFIHGVYPIKQGLAYYKARKSLGEEGLWSNVNETATRKRNQGKKPNEPREIVLNTIYGGKLAGILTQSLCREVFFDSVQLLNEVLAEEGVTNAQIIGQVHDELVVDWWPGDHTEEQVQGMMNQAMSYTTLEGFPLVADIKSAYRYIK